MFFSKNVRKDIEFLQKNDKLVYFDNACMSLRPKQVVEAITEYYNKFPACHGRSNHKTAEKLGQEIQKARANVQKFFNAKEPSEIIFTRNTTESLNIIANGLELKQGDIILTTDKEHNSNLIPWIRLQQTKGIRLIQIPSDKNNLIQVKEFERAIYLHSRKVKVIALTHMSNIDGTTTPITEIAKLAKDVGAKIIVDGAQSTPHMKIDVQELGVDAFACSAHKMMGPSGMGVLYAKRELFEQMPQFLVGGETVKDSTYSSFEPEDVPMKFEAGLQDYAGILGFSEACSYIKKIGYKQIQENDAKINAVITQGLKKEIEEEQIKIIGPVDSELRGGVFNFYVPDKDPHEIALLLDKSHNIAVRSGQHCVHSWYNARKISGSVRASFYVYNTVEEAQQFVDALKKVLSVIQ